MEIDRVQLVKGLKIERTGSEQERQRRPQTEEDFSELLDSSLEEEEQQEPEENPQPTSRSSDTVSISTGVPIPPLAYDLVSISTTARVGAEVDNAKRSLVNGTGKIEQELKKLDLPVPKSDKQADVTEDPESTPADQDDQHVDTLA